MSRDFEHPIRFSPFVYATNCITCARRVFSSQSRSIVCVGSGGEHLIVGTLCSSANTIKCFRAVTRNGKRFAFQLFISRSSRASGGANGAKKAAAAPCRFARP